MNETYITIEEAKEYYRKSNLTPAEIFKESVFTVWDMMLKEKNKSHYLMDVTHRQSLINNL